MEEASTTPSEPRKAPVKPANPDLSDDIERSVEREPFDRVKCARVFGDFYRCNWWAPFPPPQTSSTAPRQVGFSWATSATHHVRKSTFITASNDANGRLVIQKVSRIAT